MPLPWVSRELYEVMRDERDYWRAKAAERITPQVHGAPPRHLDVVLSTSVHTAEDHVARLIAVQSKDNAALRGHLTKFASDAKVAAMPTEEILRRLADWQYRPDDTAVTSEDRARAEQRVADLLALDESSV